MNEIALVRDGLPVFHGESYEEHVSTWLEVDSSVQGHYWMLGAVAASLIKRYGEDVTGKFASDVGASRDRIWRYARTYRAWENLQRSNLLSFQHHTIAARSDDPQRALEVAEDEQLSTRELEEFVKTGEIPERGRPVAPAEVASDEQKSFEAEEAGGESRIRKIVRAGAMEYLVELSDGTRETAVRKVLLEEGFKKCECCGGLGVARRDSKEGESA